MSESITETKEPEGEVISIEHLQRLLDDAKAGNAALDRQLEEERAERNRLQRERDQLAGHAGSEAERRYAAELSAADGGLAAAAADIDRAEDALAAALEAGDHRAAAKAQRAMAEASTRKGAAENKKQWLEQNKQQIVRPPVVERRESDPYSELVKDIRPSEREWLKQRPKFLTDGRYQQRVYNASGIAEAEGLSRGSDAYLHRIEEILGETRQESADPAPEPPRRPASADVAPTRRASPGAAPSGGRQLARLDPGEREIADGMWGTPGVSGYVEDADERYLKYAAFRDRAKASGRM